MPISGSVIVKKLPGRRDVKNVVFPLVLPSP